MSNQIHDFGSVGKRYWGHDYYINHIYEKGHLLELCGWKRGLKKEDWLILMIDNDTTRYQITTIKYLGLPTDLFVLKCKFVPRTNKERDEY